MEEIKEKQTDDYTIDSETSDLISAAIAGKNRRRQRLSPTIRKR